MAKPLIIDLFCGAGGAAEGYRRAGFDVIGIDIKPQPRFPFEFYQADAISVAIQIKALGLFPNAVAIHASPPCQHYTAGRRTQRLAGDNPYPDPIPPLRQALSALGLPYVIENVPGAPLIDPAMLCGQMFELRLYRHRLFETSFRLHVPSHPKHTGSMLNGSIIAVYGSKRIVSGAPRKGRNEKYANYGRIPVEFRRVSAWRKAMGIDWMTGFELKEAIPPAYTEFIGRQLLEQI